MAWLRTRATKRGASYSVQWREAGRIESVTFAENELAEAKRFRDRVEAHGNAWPPGWKQRILGHSTGHASGRTVAQQVLWAIETSPKKAAGWKAEAKRIVARYLDEATDELAVMPCGEVKHSDVLAWITRLQERKLAPKTIANAHSLLASGFALAVLDGDLSANAASGAAPGKGDAAPVGEALTPVEFETLVKAIPAGYRPLVAFLGRTGTRWSEATALQWKHVHLNGPAPYVQIAQAWKEQAQRGQFTLGPPKTRRGTRRVYIDSTTASDLAALKKKQPSDSDGFVFLTPSEGVVIRHNNFHYRIWRPTVGKLVEEGKLRSSIRIHDLRHSHASWLLEAGQPPARVAARLGHDPAVLMRTYSHVLDHGAAQAAQAIDAVLGPARKARRARS